MTTLFPPPDPETVLLLQELNAVIEKVFPLPARFAAKLPRDVEELSRLFTSGRDSRSLSYLGKPNLQSAYLRFFLPWNVFRLCRLLAALPLELKNEDTILDIGAGPLTFALALWISRRDLRNRSLEFIALDRTPSILEAGKKLFDAFTMRTAAKTGGEEAVKWRIRLLRGELGRNGFLLRRDGKNVSASPQRITRDKPAALVAAVNFFNEIYWQISPADKKGQTMLLEQSARVLAASGNRIFVFEPGIPRSGEFIAGLRSALLEKGYGIAAPCLHHEPCPFPGGTQPGKGKTKWCHFSFDTADAPSGLRKLSASAGIPKERAVLSFLLAEKKGDPVPGPLKSAVRIVSDSFRVGNGFGRYACSASGPVLVTGRNDAIGALDSGSSVTVKMSNNRDVKTSALMGEISE